MKTNDWKHLALKLFLIFNIIIAINLSVYHKTLFAKSNIIDLQIIEDENYENANIEILLSSEYNSIPQISPSQGIYTIEFFDLSIKENKIIESTIDSPIKKIILSPSPIGARLEIEYNDMLAVTAGLVSYTLNGDKINIIAKKPNTNLLINSQQEDLGQAGYNQIWVKLIWQVLAFLVVLIIIAYVIILFYKNKNIKKKANGDIKIINTYYLSPKNKIWIVEINNEQYALSVTPNSSQLIAKIDKKNKEIIDKLKNNPNYTLAKIKSELQAENNTKKLTANWQKITNPRKFKQELAFRIKNLKPIK